MANGFGPARNFRPQSYPRVRTRNTLFAVAQPIPAEVLDGDRWLAGIDYDTIALSALDCYQPGCGEDDELPDPAEDITEPVVFLPIELRSVVACSTIGLDATELEARLGARFDATDSAALVGAMIEGGSLCWGVNPSFSAATALADGPYAIDQAVAKLEDALAVRLGNALGTIFMTPGMLGFLAPKLVLSNGHYYTPMGTTIVADSGIADELVDEEQRTIYATGPFYAHRGPARPLEQVFDSFDGGDPRVLPRNVVRFIRRRMAVVVFDPSVAYQVDVSYTGAVSVS